MKLANGKNDLIAAIATGAGSGGIGIVRVSGDGITSLIPELLDRPIFPYRACHRKFIGNNGELIDDGIALLYPAPNSYTGEDILELQGHGGAAVMALLLRRCTELGARLAEPGEFTKRAVANGKLNLAQAEGIADLIAAATERAAKLAAVSASGELARVSDTYSKQLTSIRAEIEASIDFVDEEIEPTAIKELLRKIAKLQTEIEQLQQRCQASLSLRETTRICLVGAPNAGKSSLLNRLAGFSVAIVDESPGTTRDLVHAEISIHGLAIDVTDTAGLRSGGGKIEQEGMKRTRAVAEQADLVIEVIDASSPTPSSVGLQPVDIKVFNKVDIAKATKKTVDGAIYLSAKTGDGIDALHEAIAAKLGADLPVEPNLLARERHVNALTRTQQALAEIAVADCAPEIIAEYLRCAQQALDEISGTTLPDDLLEIIFKRFCIGK